MREKPWPSIACLWLRELTGAAAAIVMLAKAVCAIAAGPAFHPLDPLNAAEIETVVARAARGGICR